MTENKFVLGDFRFITECYDDGTECLYDRQTKEQYWDLTRVDDLLNELHEENKELKEEIETLHEQIAHFMEVGDVE